MSTFYLEALSIYTTTKTKVNKTKNFSCRLFYRKTRQGVDLEIE